MLEKIKRKVEAKDKTENEDRDYYRDCSEDYYGNEK